MSNVLLGTITDIKLVNDETNGGLYVISLLHGIETSRRRLYFVYELTGGRYWLVSKSGHYLLSGGNVLFHTAWGSVVDGFSEGKLLTNDVIPEHERELTWLSNLIELTYGT